MFQSFITEKYLKELTSLNKNIDMSDLNPHLQQAEMIFIREEIGQKLYDDLKTKFIAQTLSNDEKDLVNYLKPIIAYRAAEKAIPYIAMPIRNNGVVTPTGDNFAPVNLSAVKYLREELKNDAEYYTQRLKDYLCENSKLFTLYKFSTDNNPNPIEEPLNGFDCDVYIGGTTYLDNKKRNWWL